MSGTVVLGSPWTSALYWALHGFTILYPIAVSLIWMVTASFFLVRWERPGRKLTRSELPAVSILVYAHNHAATIERALAAARRMEYVPFEIVVIDDESTDATASLIAPFVQAGQVRLISKAQSEGRAMALNDAIPCLGGEILLLLDADVELAPSFLKETVCHFASPRVAAVAGNTRAGRTDTWLGRYQLIEFSVVFSLASRAHRVVGRGSAMPGMAMACRKAALQDVGYFNPQMVGDEMEMTWRLQKRSWDLRYEPRALSWKAVPGRPGALLLQRLKWAMGLLQVLFQHSDTLASRRYRRLWPLYAEAWLSVTWAVAFWVTLLALIIRSLAATHPVFAVHAPGPWEMAMATILLGQACFGLLADRRYDPQIRGMGRYLILFLAPCLLIGASVLVAAIPACGIVSLIRRIARAEGKPARPSGS